MIQELLRNLRYILQSVADRIRKVQGRVKIQARKLDSVPKTAWKRLRQKVIAKQLHSIYIKILFVDT